MTAAEYHAHEELAHRQRQAAKAAKSKLTRSMKTPPKQYANDVYAYTVDTPTETLLALLQRAKFTSELFNDAKGKMYRPFLNAAIDAYNYLSDLLIVHLGVDLETVYDHRNVGTAIAYKFIDRAADLEYVKYDYYSGRYTYTADDPANVNKAPADDPTDPPVIDPPTKPTAPINTAETSTAPLTVDTAPVVDNVDNTIASADTLTVDTATVDTIASSTATIIENGDHILCTVDDNGKPNVIIAECRYFDLTSNAKEPPAADPATNALRAEIARRGYNTNKIIIAGMPPTQPPAHDPAGLVVSADTATAPRVYNPAKDEPPAIVDLRKKLDDLINPNALLALERAAFKTVLFYRARDYATPAALAGVIIDEALEHFKRIIAQAPQTHKAKLILTHAAADLDAAYIGGRVNAATIMKNMPAAAVTKYRMLFNDGAIDYKPVKRIETHRFVDHNILIINSVDPEQFSVNSRPDYIDKPSIFSNAVDRA